MVKVAGPVGQGVTGEVSALPELFAESLGDGWMRSFFFFSGRDLLSTASPPSPPRRARSAGLRGPSLA